MMDGAMVRAALLVLPMLAWGCGGRPAASASSSPGARHETRAEATTNDVDTSSMGDGAMPAPRPPPPASGEVSSALPITTVAQAEQALAAATQKLDALFDQQAVELSNHTRCSHACRGFASLQRAVARLCELAGEDSDRCVAGRETEARNRRRIHDAACGC